MVYFSWDDKPEAFDDDKELLKLKIYRDEDKNQIVPIQLSPAEFEQLLHSQNHIFAESDNYPFLKIISGHLEGQVNLIYIDPPYNTGNFFTYNDNFSAAGDMHSGQSLVVRAIRDGRDCAREVDESLMGYSNL